MNEPNPTSCPRCGARMPAGAADGACPACLMSAALATPGSTSASDESAASEASAAPTATDLADEATVTLAADRSRAPHDPGELPREFGGYQLLGWLGAGGMGTVYEAVELATGRRVALKMLEHRLDSPDMRQRFLREGRLAASVNHPNSLYVFGSEEIGSTPVITMEIAAAGTLKDKLDRRGPLPVAEAVDAILDVIAGLEAAHEAGVLHRDVKPSNCFVGPDGSVKVGDFGLSVSTLAAEDSYATNTGVIMGTPAYAPPEQLRGDDLDARADIYSVGATLYTLLTGRAPFTGKNAVQVVANAVNQKPRPVRELRADVPARLERVVTRCLAKEPEGRYAGYTAMREALLPFSSREPEPASMTVRAQAGWIDYLIALLPPYVILMLVVGPEKLLVAPLVERSLFSARYYFLLFGLGVLYFTITEGIWGVGVGKWLKGLRVVRTDGRPPGLARAMARILVPIVLVEGVRMSLMLAWISDAEWTGLQTVGFVLAAVVCPWIAVLPALQARRHNGFATFWDRVTGTRVVVTPKGSVRLAVEPVAAAEAAAAAAPERAGWIGPYRIVRELVPGRWIVATDPVLRRPVWLLRRQSSEVSEARKNLARPGRLRWLQTVETTDVAWDAFEATPGAPLSALLEGDERVRWGTLRHWLHDLASELWAATGDRTLPAELGLDHVWITTHGVAVVLDEPWPGASPAAERFPVGDVVGQQRFLAAVAACAETTSLPVHASRVLRNVEAGRFEKISFLTGTLRGLLDRPAEVGAGIRAASIFLLPVYSAILVFIGARRGAEWMYAIIGGDSALRVAVTAALGVLAVGAIGQLLMLPFRTTAGNATFRLAVVGSDGRLAGRARLLARWAIVWLPLIVPVVLTALAIGASGNAAWFAALAVLVAWVGVATSAVVHPNRGLHDRLANTWVVRR